MITRPAVRGRRVAATGTLALLLVALLVPLIVRPSGAQAAVPQVPPGSDSTRCDRLVARVERFDPRVDRDLSTLDWRGTRIALTPSGLSGARFDSSQEALWFHSLAWLVRSAERDPAGVARLVSTYASSLADPGPDASRDRERTSGWTEGQIRRRLETMECLYRMTGRSEFAQVAVLLGSALMDDRRYYGLPLRRPHNHGAQANRLLLRTGQLFGQREWIATSRERILRDRASVFSSCGMTDEQSSAYQWLNVSIWQDLGRAAGVGEDPRAQQAAQALVRPDGVVEPVGDGRVRTGRTGGGSLWCPKDGWAAATDEGMHYIVRFGPPTTRHGHDDHGAVTWFTHGTPVLADRATAPKSDAGALAWSRGPAAHSILERVDDPREGSMSGRSIGDHAYELVADAGQHRRTVRIDPERITVSDADEATRSGTWIQHWHFAEGWEPDRSSGGQATGELVSRDGARVRLACLESGRPVTVLPVRVRSYASGVAAWAWDMQCRHRGTDVAFTSQVSWLGAAGTAGTAR